MTTSPWLIELQRDRPVRELDSRVESEVAIVGGGIAGLSTAYYLLAKTQFTVTLVEKGLVGHGASGHNGGQGVAAIERPLPELVNEIGGKAVANLLHQMGTGYDLIEELCDSVGYRGVKVRCDCNVGFQDEPELREAVNELSLRAKIGAPIQAMAVAEEMMAALGVVPEDIRNYLVATPRYRIKESMRSKDEYLACYTVPVVLLNSAQLCEDIATHLLSSYPERFRLFEGSRATEIDVRTKVKTATARGMVITDRVALCTNGYTIPRILASHRPLVEDRSRQFLASMIAYRPEGADLCGAFIFNHDQGDPEEEPYFYITRRPMKHGNAELVAVGGPQVLISGEPEGDQEIPVGVYERIDDFASRTYAPALPDFPELFWNGLMGYTQDGLRMMGQDPKVPAIWYNLGCNGVGLLPSIVGGKHVADRMVKSGDRAE